MTHIALHHKLVYDWPFPYQLCRHFVTLSSYIELCFSRSELTAFRLFFSFAFLFCEFSFPRYWKKGTPSLYYSHPLWYRTIHIKPDPEVHTVPDPLNVLIYTTFVQRGNRQCREGEHPLLQLQSCSVCEILSLPVWREIPKIKET